MGPFMDELHPGYLVGLLVLLVACSAFFSCVETALLNLDRYRLRLQAKQGLRGARRSSWLLLHDDRLRGTLLFGRTLVNVSAAALASWAPARRRGGGTGRQRTQPRRRGPASGRQPPGQRGQPA